MNEKRIEQILERIEQDPNNISLYVEYKNLCIQSKLFVEAEEAYEMIIQNVNERLQESLQVSVEIPDLGLEENVFSFLARNYYEWGMLIYKQENGSERYKDMIAIFRSSIDSDVNFEKSYEMLAECYYKENLYENWLNTQEKAIEFQKNKKLKIETLYNMKNTAEQLGETQRVIKYYQLLLEEDKVKAKENFDKLEELLESVGEWLTLAKLYEERLQERLDPKTKELYTDRLVDIYTNKAPNKDKVFLSLCENFKKNPRDAKLKDQLEEVVQNAGMHEELLSFYESIIETISDRSVKGSILVKIGDILFMHLEENSEAFTAYEKALESLPSDPYILSQQIKIISKREESEERSSKLSDLNLQLGNYYLLRVKNEEQAIDYFYNVLQTDPKNEQAFNLLMRIFTTKKMNSEKAELLKLKLNHISDEERGKTAFILAEILYKQLNDKENAGHYFKMAYDNGEKNAFPYIEEISKKQENYDTLLQYKIDSIEHIRVPKEKADALKEIGDVFQHKMGNPNKAIFYYVESLKFNAKDTDLAIMILEYVYDNALFDSVKEILNEIDRAITLKKDATLYLKLAKVAKNLNTYEQASIYYKKSSDLNKKDYETFYEFGELYEIMEDWGKALRIFQYIEMNFKSLDDSTRYELNKHLGKNSYLSGDKKAKKYIEDALSFQRVDIESLTYYYKILDQEQNIENAISVRLEVIDLLQEQQPLVELYFEIADIYKKDLKNEAKYLEFLHEVFLVGGNDKNLLMNLLDIYTKNRYFSQCVETLERLIKIETNGEQKIDYKFELLKIYETGLGDYKKTLQIYTELYEILPDDNEVIAGYENYLKKLSLWPQLISFYVDRIKKDDPKNQKGYWLTIADICANQLKDFKQSATALEQALKLDPKNSSIRLALADIYAHAGASLEQQIDLLRKNIKDNPFSEVNYQKLFNLFVQQKKLDKAYVVARVLRYFDKMGDDHKQILSAFKGKSKLEWGQILTKYQWDLVTHHRLKNQVTDIFLAMSVPMVELYSKPAKLNPKEMIDLGKTTNLFASVYKMLLTFMNLPTFEVHARQGQSGFEIQSVNGGKVMIQTGFDIFNNTSDKDLLYILGKAMTYLRPEYLLAKIVPGRVITNIFIGVLSYIIPSMNVSGDLDQLQAITKHFEKHTAPETVESIRDVVEAFVRAKGSIDLNKWLNAIEFTGNRMAYVLTQDLELLDRMFKREMVGILSKADYKLKMADILNYIVSEDYFTLRKELGMSVA